MKGRQVALGVYKDRAAAALMVDGKLEDFLIEADDATPAPGAIYRGIVDRQMKGQGGVFLRLGNGQRGFLRQAKGLAPGQPLLVQVVSHAEPGKAPPLTTRILFKSRYAIVTPDAPGVNISRQIREEEDRDRIAEIAHGIELAEGHGAILRSAARLASDEEIADDLAAMADLAEAVMSDAQGSEPELLVDAPDPAHLAWREWADPAPDQILEEDDAFEIAGVLDALEDLYRGEALASGGSMIVEPTRALVAVDVNTGGDSSP
ncbi:MAG: ribonuclease E/G, partial [Mangrovicoccus sp.]